MRSRLIFTVLVLLCLSMSACCETIGEVKKLLDGPSVMVTGVVTYVRPGECYIESADRASGIWVRCNTAVIYAGAEVIAAGWLSTINGERVITSSSLYPTGQQKLVTPLGMPLSRIGGSWFGYQDCASDRKLFQYLYQGQLVEEWRWVTPIGLNNTGLLVTTWGRVTSTDYSPTNGLRWFHLDDGSGLASDLGDSGVIVYSDADVKFGQMVSVTGISAVEAGIDDPTHLVRVIRPRSVVDVQVQAEPISLYPFSDEFDGERINLLWGKVKKFQNSGTVGQMSVESGELKIYIPQQPVSSNPYTQHLVQCVEGDWDMEVKLSFEPMFGMMVFQGVGVILKSRPEQPGNIIAAVPDGKDFNWLAAQYSLQVEPSKTSRGQIAADCALIYSEPGLDPMARSSYFKVRKRGTTVYGRASTDGINYTKEYTKQCYNRCWVAICAYSWGYQSTPGPLTAYCDYIRIKRVTE